jgi:hypothetical protein
MIRTKNIKKLLVGAALLAGMTACNKKLDQLPSTSITDATFWKTTNDLALGCNYLYSFMQGLNAQANPTKYYQAAPHQEFYANDFFGSGGNSVSNGSRQVPATSDEWTDYYKLIRAANNIIEKAQGISGDSLVINKFAGEARFFRALGYFELVKRFGDVPLITKTITETDSALYMGRTARETVLDQVYADLNYAATYCPQPDKQIVAEYGRITRTAALGMLSRVALFEGTRQKYHNYGTPSKHLTMALNAAQTIMTEGKHSLYTYSTIKDSSYFYLFQYQAQGTSRLVGGTATSVGSYAVNKETLLPKLYFTNGTIEVASNYISNAMILKNFVATKNLMNQYLYADGLPQGKSMYYKAKEDSTLTEFFNRDPRIGMTVNNKLTYNIGAGFFLPTTTYMPRKWLSYIDNNLARGFMNFWVIRYAEVLLNYAEATYELNGSISDADLDLTVNAIRNRASNNNTAKLPLLNNGFATANGLNIRDEIRREREVELAMEGFHYWDLLRWKTAEIELPKDILGPRLFPNEIQIGTAKPNVNADSLIIYESGRRFDPNKDYLWPIPTQEISLTNGKYGQNPNW